MYFVIKHLKQQIVKHTGAACFCSQTPPPCLPPSFPDATSRRESERQTTCFFGPKWSVHTHWSGIHCYCRRRLCLSLLPTPVATERTSCSRSVLLSADDPSASAAQRQGNLQRQQLPFMFSGFADHNCQPPLLTFKPLLLRFPLRIAKMYSAAGVSGGLHGRVYERRLRRVCRQLRKTAGCRGGDWAARRREDVIWQYAHL